MARPERDESELLQELPKLLRMEMHNEGDLAGRINELIRAQFKKTHSGTLHNILNDALALIGQQWSDRLKAVETDEGNMIKERSQKFEHVIDRLIKYTNNVPNNELAPNLFKAEFSKIKYEDKEIEVEELQCGKWGWALVKDSKSGDLYLDYLIPRGFVDYPAIYKLSNQEKEVYEAGQLDLEELYQAILRKK